MTENLKNCLDFFKKESLAHPGNEVVGFLGEKNNVPFAKMVKNRAPDPKNFFAIDPLETLNFRREYEFLAIFHSHIYGDSQFSEWDIVTSDNCCLPFIVYSIPEDKFNLYVPPSNEVCSVKIERIKECFND
jgi:proteasome lid subunit RPN8/RPN11